MVEVVGICSVHRVHTLYSNVQMYVDIHGLGYSIQTAAVSQSVSQSLASGWHVVLTKSIDQQVNMSAGLAAMKRPAAPRRFAHGDRRDVLGLCDISSEQTRRARTAHKAHWHTEPLALAVVNGEP